MKLERSEGFRDRSVASQRVPTHELASVLQELAPKKEKQENRRRGAGAVASWTLGIANSSIRFVRAAGTQCDERASAGGVAVKSRSGSDRESVRVDAVTR